MTTVFTVKIALTGLALVLMAIQTCTAQTADLGDGFRHHGVATPISQPRGIVATVDGDGRNVALVWLFDHRGGYAILMIDAQTGESEEFPTPFPTGSNTPYTSLLSSQNKYYTHFNSHFVEFDPVARAFTFHAKTAPNMAMSMTEDDNGVIWAATYPNSGLVAFDPRTRECTDYGHLHAENWAQYQRSIAVDDTGWVYFAVGNTLSHIIGFNPADRTAKPMIPEDERGQGTAYVYRDMDGKAYGRPVGAVADNWYELYGGEARKISDKAKNNPVPVISSSQNLFHRAFPDGKRISVLDLVERVMEVENPADETTTRVEFDYSSEGAHIMGVAAAPDGTICGGTAFPMRFFSYNPRTDEWVNRSAYMQWNTVTRQGDRFYVGGYPHGYILDWDPAAPWVDTEKDKAGCNPLFIAQAWPHIDRPHDLLAHPDGRMMILAGTPGYGYTGGGLMLWDRLSGEVTVLTHEDLLRDHSTAALVALPDGSVLCGSTISAGTGGEKKAPQAELFILDMNTRQVVWREAVLEGVGEYTDLRPGRDGLVYGIADRRLFFVFDSADRRIIHQKALDESFGVPIYQQGPRIFVTTPTDEIYMLFTKGIARLDESDFSITMIAPSPVSVSIGGDYLDGRIYFGRGSHLYSWEIPVAAVETD